MEIQPGLPQALVAPPERPLVALRDADLQRAALSYDPLAVERAKSSKAEEARGRVLKAYYNIGREANMRKNHGWRRDSPPIPEGAAMNLLNNAIVLGPTHPLVELICRSVEHDTEFRRCFVPPAPMTAEKREHLDRLMATLGVKYPIDHSRYKELFGELREEDKLVGETDEVFGVWHEGVPRIDGANSRYAAIRDFVANRSAPVFPVPQIANWMRAVPAPGSNAGPANGSNAGPANGSSAGPANGFNAGPANGNNGGN